MIMNILESSILLEEKGIKMEEEFSDLEIDTSKKSRRMKVEDNAYLNDQKQPKIEKEADNCDQKDDIGNETGKFGSSETKETSKEKENSVTKEYFDLPYGWIKEVVSTKNQPSMRGKVREDIYLISPGSNGKKIKSAIKLHIFLEENPNIKCDLEVTSTSRVKHREFLLNQKNL